MGLIPESKIAEIRDRTDIVAIIGEHVPLRRAGVNHLGLCPFHQEKSPSFNVSASKQFFYCFGCQKSGDVFRFLMELEGRTFVDVARDLARRAGVDIPEEAAEASPQRRAQRLQQESERARLLKLCELAARFYEAQLAEHERARHYIESRGISTEIRARFRLGYAPPAWDALIRVMAQRGVPHELAESAGLVLRKEGVAALPVGAPATAQTHYDRFRDRVMFPLLVPIIGPAARAAGAPVVGDVIAFGGRVLPEAHPEAGAAKSEGAKYINSPETPLYKKGDNLYGLHAAREPIRQRRQVILVEGNFDVLALHQHGFENTVAPMGTALTEAQIQKLSRLLAPDGHVVLMLDGDKAGRSATMKDIALFMFSQANLSDVALLSQRDVDVRVARLPDGEDPDTFAQRDREALARCVRAAKPALDYVLDEAIAQAEHDSVAGKAKVLAKVAPLLKSLRNQTVQELHVDRLASSLGISTDLVWRHLQGVQIPSMATITNAPTRSPAAVAPRAPAHPGTGGSAPQQSGRPPPDRPPQLDRRPPSDRQAPPLARQSSSPDRRAPSFDRQAPPSDRQAPSLDRQAPPPDRQAPPPDRQAPPFDRQPSFGRQPPSLDRQASPPDWQAPSLDRPPPTERRPSPPGSLPARSPGFTAPPVSPGRPALRGSAVRPGDTVVRELLAMCGDHPRLIPLLTEEVLQSIDNPALSDLLRDARDLATAGSTPDGTPEAPEGTLVSVDKLIGLAPPEVRSLVATAALSGKFIHTENPEAELYRICRDLRAHAIQREVIDLQKVLIRINKAGQEPSRQQLLERIQELTLLRSQLLSNSLVGSLVGSPSPQDSHTGQPGPGAGGHSALTTEGDTPR